MLLLNSLSSFPRNALSGRNLTDTIITEGLTIKMTSHAFLDFVRQLSDYYEGPSVNELTLMTETDVNEMNYYESDVYELNNLDFVLDL